MESWPTARRWDVGAGELGTDAVKGLPPVGGWRYGQVVEGIIARGCGGTLRGW